MTMHDVQNPIGMCGSTLRACVSDTGRAKLVWLDGARHGWSSSSDFRDLASVMVT